MPTVATSLVLEPLNDDRLLARCGHRELLSRVGVTERGPRRTIP
jgi:hypothetical protein